MKTMLLALMLGATVLPATAADLMNFWEARPRHGGNLFNQQPPSAAQLKLARSQGIEWMRISYDKWRPAQRDFLIGSADDYQGLVAADLATLRQVLDNAQAAGIKVVLAPLSLPGMRWSQNNGDKFDGRLWQDKRYWQQSAQFWQALAAELKDHPAVAAYNIINEPAPEKGSTLAEDGSPAEFKAWYAQNKGSARDLPGFYREVIAAIRSVDAKTPLMLDGGWYAGSRGLSYWPDKVGDERTLYAFHMYEPFSWSSSRNIKRQQPLHYPGRIGELDWDRGQIAAWLAPTYQWAREQGIAPNRMVAAEFGCHRQSPGCARYLDDVLSTVEAQQSHWAFYSWRDDVYDGYDYELGDKKLPWQYWQAQQQGKPFVLKRGPNPVYAPISRRLEASKP